MNRQIRKVAFFTLILFGAIFLRLNWIQLAQAQRLASDDRNKRLLVKEYSIERGAMLSLDQQTLALSEPRPESELRYLRVYPMGQLFSHVTGYYSVRFGRGGLERGFNNVLTGETGVITIREIGDRLLGEGRKGDTLLLSIHSSVQQAAIDALAATGRQGAVFAMDPVNGEVLALVSNPSFDPNPLSQHDATIQENTWNALNNDPSKPLLNRATRESYPPGSTFKVLTAAAALENGFGVDTTYEATREYQPPQTDRKVGNFGGGSCGGNMADALRVSCNTYFARLGAELSAEALETTAQGFGFGERPELGIQVSASRMPSSEALASPAFRAQAAIGQFEVSATPMQMALVAAGIANSGKVMQPRIVKEIHDFRGTRLRETEPSVWKEAIRQDTATTLKDLMVSVVDSGTGTRAQISGVKVAGKTGTAQTGRPDDSNHAWFIAFAPADTPRIAIAVLVESGGEGSNETGGRIAAPIAKAVMEAHRGAAGW
ncbi:MAG: penicillin-binding protein 2 [Actinobacteria bacterium]|nr:penicillin-binding protein 2 [Actinomycetota bacterium]